MKLYYKDVAELSGELFASKPLFHWGMHSNCSENSLVLFVLRATWLSRGKKGAISGHFLLIPLCLGEKRQEKNRAQPWYARKSGESPGQFPTPPCSVIRFRLEIDL